MVQKNKNHCPRWVWSMHRLMIPMQIRHFYAYLCKFGPAGNWQWNCRLAKQFRVTPRTIRRWLEWLKAKNLIWIEKPFGNQRRIHARYFKDAMSWLASIAFLQATKSTKTIQYSSRTIAERKKRQIRELLKT